MFGKNDVSKFLIKNGELGINGYTNQIFPVLVPFQAYDIQTGENYSIIIKNDGVIYSTGINQFGQLGIGSNTFSNYFQMINQLSLSKSYYNQVHSTRLYSVITPKNLSICNTKSQFENNVCNNNGYCINNKCQCYYGYEGANCENIICYKISSKDKICSGKGFCLSPDFCQCFKNYYGEICQFFDCFNKTKNDPSVCNSQGNCTEPNKCLCNFFYIGDNCDNGLILYLIIAFPNILILSISCLTIIFFLLIFIIITHFYQTRKKYMLKNKELTEKLLMISDLTKINFNSIKFDKNKNGSYVSLGSGSTSIVYSGVFENNRVAIKLVNNDTVGNTILTEILLLRSLTNENIIRYYGYSFDYVGNFYIIIELCSNGTLESYIAKNHNLPIQNKYGIILDICKGIKYLHTLPTPIIHRDLKTQNILLDDNLKGKISDFGISKYSNENLGVITLDQKGTPAYQSPEQFPQMNKPNVGKYSDVYSFGNIIYEIL